MAYVCELCNYSNPLNYHYKNHLLTSKHKTNVYIEDAFQKKLYKCIQCHYASNFKGAYDAHLKAAYHLNSQGRRW